MSESTDSHNPAPTEGLKGAIFWIAIVFSAFQVYTAAFSPISSQVVRAVHVGFVLLMVFALKPGWLGDGTQGFKPLAWLMGITGFVFSLYHGYFEADLTLRAGELTRMDWVIGMVTVALVFEAARRMMGWTLPSFACCSWATACLANTCLIFWCTAALGWTRSSAHWPLVQRAFMAFPPMCRPRTFSCSSCSARF